MRSNEAPHQQGATYRCIIQRIERSHQDLVTVILEMVDLMRVCLTYQRSVTGDQCGFQGDRAFIHDASSHISGAASPERALC